MTSTESLESAQRDLLLELGFRQHHGFQYSVQTKDFRSVVVTRIGREDEPEGQVWEVETTAGSIVDLFRFVPGVSTRTFRVVIASLL